MAKDEIKEVFSFRMQPSLRNETKANAEKCGTDLGAIIHDAFASFNKTFDKVNPSGKE